MIKQDIICTCKENVDTKKKYIYMRDIHTQEGKFLLRTLLSFITRTIEKCMIEMFLSFTPHFLFSFTILPFISTSEYFYAEMYMTEFPVTHDITIFVLN